MSTPAPHAALALSPRGALYFQDGYEGQGLPPVPDRIRSRFALGGAQGLLQLGLSETGTELSPSLSYWRDFARLYFSSLCGLPGLSEFTALDLPVCPAPQGEPKGDGELERLVAAAPPMLGIEYLSVDGLSTLWEDLDRAFREELGKSGLSVQAFFESHGAAWSGVGKVCFHLAENKSDEASPFAFLATYSHSLSSQGKAQHLPLGRALTEYAGEKNKAQLLKLLLPVQKASSGSPFLKKLVDSGDLYHPLAWSPQEAFQFFKEVSVFESAGIVVRVPDWWKTRHPPRPQVSVTVGGNRESAMGISALLAFSVDVTLQGEKLSRKEIAEILAGTSGLVLIRGKWVEIDREKLKEVLDHWKKVERQAGEGGLSFIEGMRLLSGAAIGRDDEVLGLSTTQEWSEVVAGPALARQLEQLRDPAGSFKADIDPGAELKASLRPYQKVGVQWLWFLNRLGLGGCLADDMGLGKTIQVISLLLLLKRERPNEKHGGQKSSTSGTSDATGPALLIVPASLIGNWKSELDRFAPSLRYRIAHPSAGPSQAKGSEMTYPALLQDQPDLVITTYGYLGRQTWLTETQWSLLVIDEAQAIKNAGSKQTRAVKALKSRHRIALTGTPVENSLADLWSLYDFLCPGLLGTAKEFERYVKGAEKAASAATPGAQAQHRFTSLRNLVRPYLLRRLKTDKRIIADLPEKIELPAYCGLTKTQAALYQQSVDELAHKIETLDGIQRRGVVLAYLMRFKQICNHPSQWLSDGRYVAEESGKFGRLTEICEEIAAKQEKVLVFTQFREMTAPLSQHLARVFGRPGLVLHGETAVKKRKELVDRFQEDLGPPFFVLSLKAGGTGLNLTAASHVIHFDRWWNPAVENQATDRAYRIGQKKNVLVHKFVCRGTIEERIERLISSKQSLSQEVLEGGGDTLLTELSNSELLKMVTLDIRSAAEES